MLVSINLCRLSLTRSIFIYLIVVLWISQQRIKSVLQCYPEAGDFSWKHRLNSGPCGGSQGGSGGCEVTGKMWETTLTEEMERDQTRPQPRCAEYGPGALWDAVSTI